jgi:hypothetical protein
VFEQVQRILAKVAYHINEMGATAWGLLDMHRARRPPFFFRGGVNLPSMDNICKAKSTRLTCSKRKAQSATARADGPGTVWALRALIRHLCGILPCMPRNSSDWAACFRALFADNFSSKLHWGRRAKNTCVIEVHLNGMHVELRYCSGLFVPDPTGPLATVYMFVFTCAPE